MATKAEREKALAAKMKKKGATGVPNEETYVATAHEQAMAGNTKGAMDTMQYSVANPASSDIEKQDAAKMKKDDKSSSKRYKEYRKSMK